MITTKDLATAAGPIYYVPQARLDSPRERRPEEVRAARIQNARKGIGEEIQRILFKAHLWTDTERHQLGREIEECLRRSQKRIENSGCVPATTVVKSPQ